MGDTVVIEKAGEVIPRSSACWWKSGPRGRLPFVMPDRCPACGSQVIREPDEVVGRCTGATCPAKRREAILHFASRSGMDIQGLGEALVDQLLAGGRVRDVADLYGLDLEHPGGARAHGQELGRQLLAQIEASQSRPLHRAPLRARASATSASGPRRCWPGSSATAEALADAAERCLREVPEIGPKTAASVRVFFESARQPDLLDPFGRRRRRHARPSPTERAARAARRALGRGKTVVLTGSLSGLTREQARARLEALGARWWER